MITLVHDQGGDWIGLYRDGIIVYEGHSISESQLLTLLNIEHENIYDADTELTADHFPTKLEDVMVI